VVADADVIHDKAFVFGLPAYSVYAGDRLKQAMSDDNLVEIHDLLHRRIEASD
jgi:hypothetical protein